MGYYIETGERKGKAAWLVKNANGSMEKRPGDIPVVVLDNGPFEAAGIAYDAEEFEAFTSPDDLHKKTIIYVPEADVVRLCPSVERHLE